MRKLLLLNVFIGYCFIHAFAQNVDSLMIQARSLIGQNRSQDAALIYETILFCDSANYESYIFLSNYHFLLGKKATEKADSDFQTISQPSRMQMAHYHDSLKSIYFAYYEKANGYLQKALQIKNNDHLEELNGAIQSFKVKVGLVPEEGRRKSTIQVKPQSK
jgi:tetratricopeptide (TPR) repeat protein